MDWYCQDCYIQGACSYGSDWYYVRVGLCLIPLYVSTLVFTFCFVFISCCAYVFFPFNVDIPASMTKKIYLRHGLGVGAFRRTDGWSKRNGSRPPHFFKRSGAIDRHILQQLQKVNIIDIWSEGVSYQLTMYNILFFLSFSQEIFIFPYCENCDIGELWSCIHSFKNHVIPCFHISLARTLSKPFVISLGSIVTISSFANFERMKKSRHLAH